MRNYHEQMDKRMFDFEDFYTRIAAELPAAATVVEVGVADGSSSIFMVEALLNQEKTFTFWMVDDLSYGGPDQLYAVMRHVCLANLGQHINILPLDSLNASCRFPDQSLHFVFIDASHRYELTKADIRLWWRKIAPGGILAGHDYNDNDGQEVKRAVSEILVTHGLVVEETPKGFGVWWVRKPEGS